MEKLAAEGDARRFPFSLPLKKYKDCNFSYAGTKTAVRLAVEERLPEGPTPANRQVSHREHRVSALEIVKVVFVSTLASPAGSLFVEPEKLHRMPCWRSKPQFCSGGFKGYHQLGSTRHSNRKYWLCFGYLDRDSYASGSSGHRCLVPEGRCRASGGTRCAGRAVGMRRLSGSTTPRGRGGRRRERARACGTRVDSRCLGTRVRLPSAVTLHRQWHHDRVGGVGTVG